MVDRLKFNSIVLFVALIGVLFSVGGCATTKQEMIDSGLKPVSESEFKELFSKTFEADFYSVKKNTNVLLTYHSDGKIEAQSGNFSDEGTFWIEKDMECSKWNKIRNGAAGYHTWFKVDERKYAIFTSSGSKHGTLTLKEP